MSKKEILACMQMMLMELESRASYIKAMRVMEGYYVGV